MLLNEKNVFLLDQELID